VRELYVFCEGSTEQGFCKQLLAPHLFLGGDGRIHSIRIAHSKHHGQVHRGGVPTRYEVLRRDISNTLRSRKQVDVYFTTMIDLYGLPDDFPGRSEHQRDPGNPTLYVDALEKYFDLDIGDRRFIPYLQLHEYEAMLFANPDAFRDSFDKCDEAIEELKRIVQTHPSIEHIDDGAETAPSKRIIKLLPEYKGRKSSPGPDIAEFIGLAVIREKCRHVNAWLTRLEQLRVGS
jgi:Domain of unknown function (DUF4276)